MNSRVRFELLISHYAYYQAGMLAFLAELIVDTHTIMRPICFCSFTPCNAAAADAGFTSKGQPPYAHAASS